MTSELAWDDALLVILAELAFFCLGRMCGCIGRFASMNAPVLLQSFDGITDHRQDIWGERQGDEAFESVKNSTLCGFLINLALAILFFWLTASLLRSGNTHWLPFVGSFAVGIPVCIVSGRRKFRSFAGQEVKERAANRQAEALKAVYKHVCDQAGGADSLNLAVNRMSEEEQKKFAEEMIAAADRMTEGGQ